MNSSTQSPPRTHRAEDWPLVTVAIPLYRSARFLPIIIENIDTLDYPNLEFIISDRHGEDDALAQLADRYAHDPRLRFIAATDGINWIAHYNSLLDAASGDYMFWLPHDDSCAPDYVRRLVAALEANPAALLAFGTIKPVDEKGNPLSLELAKTDWHACIHASRSWSVTTALRLLIYWNLGIPMRGLFRPAPLRAEGLYIKETPYLAWADVFWVFGVALRGPLQFVPGAIWIKRFHAHNTHRAWVPIHRMGDRWQVFQILRGYAQEQTSSVPARLWAILVLVIFELFPRRVRHLFLQPLVGKYSTGRAESFTANTTGVENRNSNGKKESAISEEIPE